MLLVGNDAEFILTRANSPVSAIGLIGGSKIAPLKVEEGALQEDNVLAEINIVPAPNEEVWNSRINIVVGHLRKKLPRGIILSRKASAFYPEEELIHPKAREFGCDPDYNAWTGEVNPKPEAGDSRLRSAGGHIHIGIRKISRYDKMALIRCMDTVIGLQTVILDKDIERKKLYGKAGAMRYKPYGVEWRTPSNFWIFNENLRKWIFTSAVFCANNYQNKALTKFITGDVPAFINMNSVNEARTYLRIINKTVRIPLHGRI